MRRKKVSRYSLHAMGAGSPAQLLLPWERWWHCRVPILLRAGILPFFPATFTVYFYLQSHAEVWVLSASGRMEHLDWTRHLLSRSARLSKAETRCHQNLLPNLSGSELCPWAVPWHVLQGAWAFFRLCTPRCCSGEPGPCRAHLQDTLQDNPLQGAFLREQVSSWGQMSWEGPWVDIALPYSTGTTFCMEEVSLRGLSISLRCAGSTETCWLLRNCQILKLSTHVKGIMKTQLCSTGSQI